MAVHCTGPRERLAQRGAIAFPALSLAIALLAASGCAASSSRPPAAAAAQVSTDASVRYRAGERAIRRSAALAVAVRDVDAAARRAAQLVNDAGGYLENLDLAGHNVAELRARVPAAELDRALGALAELGRELSRSLTGEDVGEQIVDLDASLASKRVLRERLRALAEAGGTVGDLLQVETELARVQGEIERLEAQLERLRGQVQLASLSLQLERQRWPGPLGVLSRALGEAFEWLFRQPQGRVLPIP